MTEREHLLDYHPARIGEYVASIQAESFRATQILQWIYERGAKSFESMTNLSKALREKLAAEFDLYASTIVRRAASSDGTVKLLLQWQDGATSEAVLIPADDRMTACISSQVGCPVGCRFCASGLEGVERNLTAGQIVEQVLRIRAEAAGITTGNTEGTENRTPISESSVTSVVNSPRGRLSNVVFMGLGEPLANYDNVMRAVRTINAPWGLNIGARKITISTVGLPKQIRRLADEGLQLNLALSLHAPSDALRAELIPWAEKISIAQITHACRYYFEQTGREITLEYILLHNVNDRPAHAAQLARFAKNLRCNVNLIRYNPVEGLPYERPTSEATAAFQRYLREHGVNSHIRTSRGLDIDAACGQLRRKQMLPANVPLTRLDGPP